MPSEYARLPTDDEHREPDLRVNDDQREDDSDDDENTPLHFTPASAHLNKTRDDDDDELDTRIPLSSSAPAPHVPGAFVTAGDHGPLSPPITAYGNSNGDLPEAQPTRGVTRPNMLKRALGALLPSHYVRDRRGGGVGNDGVFANIAAKPVQPSASGSGIRDPVTGAYISPEETQREVPPVSTLRIPSGCDAGFLHPSFPQSYAAAQADAVPAYGDTPTTATQSADGELIVDLMPTGSLFSFLWNLLVSMSFQFVGFLLTYLLHSTHAAKFGSRAGLGVTLIQYGFYLRTRDQQSEPADTNGWGWPDNNQPKPTFATAEDARKYYEALAAVGANSTASSFDLDNSGTPAWQSASGATEWMSFLLMTVGWFVLLTAVLGFWRVKRWERSVRQAAYEAAHPRPPPTPEEIAREQAVIQSIEQAFGLVSSRVTNGADSLRAGLGLPLNWEETPGERDRRERESAHA